MPIAIFSSIGGGDKLKFCANVKFIKFTIIREITNTMNFFMSLMFGVIRIEYAFCVKALNKLLISGFKVLSGPEPLFYLKIFWRIGNI